MCFTGKLATLKKKNFLSHSVFTGIAFAFYGGTKFAFNLLVQIVYGSETVGNYNLVLSSAMIAPLFITSIFGIAMSKFASEARGKKDHQRFLFFVGFNFWVFLLLAAASSVIYLLFSQRIALLVKGSAHIFVWGPPIIFLFCIYNFFRRLYYILEKIKLYTLLEVTSSILFFICLAVCLVKKLENSLLLPMIVHLGFFSAVSFFLCFKYIRQMSWLTRFKEYKSPLAAFFKYSLITGFGTALTAISLHIFTIVLGKCADIKSVGHFSLVRSTVEPSSYLFRIVGMVNFPKIAYIYGSGNIAALKSFVKDNFKKFSIFVSLLFLPAVLLTPYFSRFLFKTENTGGLVLLFALMLLTLYLRTVGVFHLNFLSATRYPLFPNIISPVSIFIVIPFIPFVFNSFGPGGLGVLIFSAEVVRSACIILMGEKKLMEIEKETP